MLSQAHENSERLGVTPRVILLSLGLIAALSPAAFYGEILFGTTYEFGSGVPSMAALAVLFLVAALNQLVSGLGRSGLRRREILALYAIIAVGAPLVSHGILLNMFSTPIFQHYLARAIPSWQTTFLHHMPSWFSVTDAAAVDAYFEGGASVPWSLWWAPLAAWTSFMLALYLASLFLVVLLRRQWITHERLSFPLAQIPLGVVRAAEAEGRGRLPVSGVFWIGFLVSCGITSVNRLASVYPAIPNIPLAGVTVIPWNPVGPLAGLGAWELWIIPWMIAVAYLIPKELSFSCWFFWLVRIGLTVAAITAGATPQRPEEWWGSEFPAPTFQGGGAVLAVALWVLWTARRHAKHAFLSIFTRGSAADVGEPLPYRWALLGFLVCSAYLVCFYWVAGCRPQAGLIFAGLIVVHYIVWARLRAETGLGFIPFPLIVGFMVAVPFGTAIFRPREVVALMCTRWSYFPGFGQSLEVCTGNALEGLKIADSASISSRRLVYAMIGAFLLAVVVGVYVVLVGIYHYGFFDTRAAWSGWLYHILRQTGTHSYQWLADPWSPNLNGTIAMAAGALVTFALGILRLRFWWWPFHPIGYLAAFCWGMHWFSQPFFIGWLLKTLTVRYGGLRLYRRTVPLAIGVIMGDFVGQGAWVLGVSVLRGFGAGF